MKNWKMFAVTFSLVILPLHAASQSSKEWSVYGGNLAGQHYSGLRQVNTNNVHNLAVAWTFHTGTLKIPSSANKRASFEANPVFWNKTLYLTSPFDEIFALNGLTGQLRWKYDPKVARDSVRGIVTSRGVALWHSPPRQKLKQCSSRIFMATLDARLIALDAETGKLCDSFGTRGTIDLAKSLGIRDKTWYEFTSPPTVVANTIVIGSSVGDNQAVEMPSGAVRGFDARNGKLLWTWEPIPWASNQHPRTGAANAWSTISADPKLGLAYIPTGSASPDYYGVLRPGDGRDADSVVALNVRTGEKVWSFQTVHHDIWDYDVAAEPVLFRFRNKIPAIAITTKTGMVFVLNRKTGQPIYPVLERPVPQSNIPGEKTSATQPFSSLPSLIPLSFTPDEAFGNDASARKFCHDKVAALVNNGIFTPISTYSTLEYPGVVGGVNWGSPALDPKSEVLYVNTNRLAFNVRLVPRTNPSASLTDRIWRRIERDMGPWSAVTAEPAEKNEPVELRFRAPDGFGQELNAQSGTPYMLFVEPLLAPDGLPCTPQPWGQITAMDLNRGKIIWSKPLGTMIQGQHTGSVNTGGPIVTDGELVFTAATVQPILRAFDAVNGNEVWSGTLPGSAQSTPMTYSIDGRQFIVICAGGSEFAGGPQGDSVVAYALKVSRKQLLSR